jgi:hypothetical protein
VIKTTADVIYRFSVYGLRDNLIGAENLLMKLFREQIQGKYELVGNSETLDSLNNPCFIISYLN